MDVIDFSAFKNQTCPRRPTECDFLDLCRKLNWLGTYVCNLTDSDMQTLTVDNSTGDLTISNGNTVNLCGVVSLCETVTTLVNNNDGTYTYTNEDGTQTIVDIRDDSNTTYNLVDNSDGTISLIGSDSTNIPVDICAIVAANCPPVLTSISISGDTITYIDENGNPTNITITHPTDIVTNIVDNGDGTITYTNETGTPTTIDICALIATSCPPIVTTLVDNGDGTFTYTNEDNVPVTWSETLTSISIVGNVITYIDEDGNPTNLTLPDSPLTTVTNNNDGTVTYVDEQGNPTVIDVCGIIAANCSDELTNNNDGTFTHVSNNGTSTIIDVCAAAQAGGCLPSIVNNGDNTYTFNDGYGGTTVINVNEIDADINNVTLTGSVVTFTSEDGTQIPLDICAVVAANCNATTTINADGSATFVDNAGNSVTLPPSPASVVTATVTTGNQIGSHDDGSGTVVDLFETVTTNIDNGDGTWTLTSEDGTVTTIDVCAAVAANCADTLVDNGDGTYSHTSVDGTAITIDVCAAILAGGCTDVLVRNGTSALGGNLVEHTALDGTVQTFCEGFDSVRAGLPCSSVEGGTVGIDVTKMVRDITLVGKELVVDAAPEHTSGCIQAGIGAAFADTDASAVGTITGNSVTQVVNNPSSCRSVAHHYILYGTFSSSFEAGARWFEQHWISINGGAFSNTSQAGYEYPGTDSVVTGHPRQVTVRCQATLAAGGSISLELQPRVRTVTTTGTNTVHTASVSIRSFYSTKGNVV